MRMFDKIFLALFTKSTDKIISTRGIFSINIPTGFRYKSSSKLYQILNPIDPSFLLQISDHTLIDIENNHFNIERELNNTIRENPNAVIQSIGKYNCVGYETVTQDEKLRTFVWRIGEKNKRILVTLTLRNIEEAEVSNKLLIAKNLLSSIKIIHCT